MESIDAIKALILGLFFTGIFYLVFPIPVIQSEYWLQLFSGHISETIVALVLWSLFLIFFKRHLCQGCGREDIGNQSVYAGAKSKEISGQRHFPESTPHIKTPQSHS
jgi:hypothetical protein